MLGTEVQLIMKGHLRGGLHANQKVGDINFLGLPLVEIDGTMEVDFVILQRTL
jgi:hypothetical protein